MLYQFSLSRWAWMLLMGIALALELCAVYFQHILGLQPCVLCIYERVAMFGVMFAGLLGVIQPKNPLLRIPAYALWLYSSWQGLVISWQHVDKQLNPSPFNICPLYPDFPSWLPLADWIPALFAATGDCSTEQWSMWGLSMPQWLVVAFGCFFAAGVIFVLVQLWAWIRPRPQPRRYF